MRKRTALRSLKDYNEILNDEAYQRGSKHYSYLFRHSLLSHKDGSLSLNEMLHHRGTTQKLKHMRDNCDKRVLRVNKEEVQNKSRHSAIEFLMPAAHLCCDSNKARCQIGYITEEEYTPGTLVSEENWMTPGDFDDDDRRTVQADLLEPLNIATFFFQFESGHSNKAEVLHDEFDFTNIRAGISSMEPTRGTSTRSVSASCCLEEHAEAEKMYTLFWITLLLL